MLAALFLIGAAAVVATPAIISATGTDAEPSDDGEGTDETAEMDEAEATGDLVQMAIEPDAEASESGDGAVAGDENAQELPGTESAAAAALVPTGGEAPEDHPPPPLPGAALAPVDPDLPDVPADDPPGLMALSPTTGDAPEDGYGEVSGDDEPEIIEGFVPGQDVLELELPPDLPADAVTITVSPGPDGADGHVTANERLIAILRGAPEAGPEDVRIGVYPVPSA